MRRFVTQVCGHVAGMAVSDQANQGIRPDSGLAVFRTRGTGGENHQRLESV